jgi:hypothetical protein
MNSEELIYILKKLNKEHIDLGEIYNYYNEHSDEIKSGIKSIKELRRAFLSERIEVVKKDLFKLESLLKECC